ncbi:TetR/AcrR family transcriptional regulator [Spongiactinospora sp. TRM90649]|uniref:TetR/AcrR family transcriptional regulator n=1 Tax=Spongiactinospora sp. TRM90649 TaxID=3031114 RepID=UPI0023F93E4F|nr:TetR/AcrR family transcriptional regulator [Spongiactinospora sp. TRM90649]MDF5752806.1 TetR/AcrR family transcriptional regulator [Spongiactinospora sp. TRM90649]
MDEDLVAAALVAAERHGKDVADVPLGAIAAAAGISRSTLIRRLGGSRAGLEEAVRQTGIDPGGRPPVRERAIEAAAVLIARDGLGAVTMDAVAVAADCSPTSLHATFGNRDGLLATMFDRYVPVPDLEALAADPPERIQDMVHAVYTALAEAFDREPRVLPAIFGDLFTRPDGTAARMLKANLPRMLDSLGAVLNAQIHAGRLRPLPLPLLIQLMIGPMAGHMLLRPVLQDALGDGLPPVRDVTQVFAEAFLRATAL